MSAVKDFMKAGHWPTLLLAFLYFDFCFAIWVMNGAMAPFITEAFKLSPAERGFMISVPIISGALLRFPLGLLAQYIGRKNAAMLEMGVIIIALLYGYFFADTYPEVIIMGIMLGIAGASFGVALSLGGGWYPPKYKGLAIGIAGAGNSGAIVAVLAAPPLAINYGYQSVYGFAVILMVIPLVLMWLYAKEPPDIEKKSLGGYLKVIVEKDAWIFNISYILTFGGYIGIASFLPTFFHDQYGIPKGQMGQYAAIIIIMASISRIAGGMIADRWGGIRVMTTVCVLVAITSLLASTLPSIWTITLILIILFLALGAGNGATFQLVPLRFAGTTAVAMSLIGEIGALGGAFIPNLMGLSKQHFGTFSYGFAAWGILAVVIFIMYLAVARRWAASWVGKGGKALTAEEYARRRPEGTVAEAKYGAHGPYKTVICPIGETALSDPALEQAAYLSKISGARLILLHVVEKHHQAAVLITDSKEWNTVHRQWLDAGWKLLEEKVSALEASGIKNVEKMLSEGDAAYEIVRLASEQRADLIVMASHSYAPMGKLFMGSIIDKVTKKAPCPVLWVIK